MLPKHPYSSCHYQQQVKLLTLCLCLCLSLCVRTEIQSRVESIYLTPRRFSLMLCLEVLREIRVEGMRVVEKRLEGNDYPPPYLDVIKIK